VAVPPPEGIWETIKEATRIVLCGEDEPKVTRFLVLLKSRKSAAICVGMSRWPGELLEVPGYVRAEVAPTPDDAFWPNLLKPDWRMRVNYAIGLLATVSLFLFWTLPVAAVQALSSLNHIAYADGTPDWLRDFLKNLGEENLATLSGYISASVLQLFLYLTQYSGLFQWLARMLGATSESEVTRIAQARVLLFQLLLVLLASNIASSLFDSLQTLLNDPLSLPRMFAQNLPGQSTFFMHYSLSGILYVNIFDTLQLNELIVFVFKGMPCKADDVPAPPPYSAHDRRQRYIMIYAKLYLMMGIWLTFFLIAPMNILIGFIYFVPSYFIYPTLLRHIDGPPEVDTGGDCWEQAIRYTNWTYHIAHVLLIGILTLKRMMEGAVLVGIALVYVAFRTSRLKAKFSGRATALSLQRCVDLQEAGDSTYDSLHPYSTDEGKASEAEWRAESLRKRVQGEGTTTTSSRQSQGFIAGLFGGDAPGKEQ